PQRRPVTRAAPPAGTPPRGGAPPGGLPGSAPVLDPLGSHRPLPYNLILRKPRELPACHDPQPVVDPEREAATAPRRGKDGVAAILANRDEAQFLHWRPSCAAG